MLKLISRSNGSKVKFHLTRWGIVALAVVVALGSVGVTYANWKGHGHGWGNLNHFWRPDLTVCSSYTNCSACFLTASAHDNETIKDVAETTVDKQDCDTLIITINNAYPGYEGIVDFCIQNIGIMVATITTININIHNLGYLQIDLNGDVQEGADIQPGEIKCGQLVIHGLPQENTQNRTFTFDININIECGPRECETAYAYYPGNAQCFLDLGYTKWGWTNGPLSPGHYEFDIYAGAGQCDLSKGENIGTLTVDYDESTHTVTVNYDITGSGYWMTETHLYVGNDPLPPNPGKPGQYPYSHTLDNETTDDYTITGLYGDIYIIAHAVACQ